MAQDRERVVVLGGGVGAITTAFALTDPRHAGRYDVTLYQLGWRLGGKGASGRGPNKRIEEHGLHLWFGFYENAFREMRACYEELGRGPGVPIRTVDEAFHPASRFGVAAHRLDRWSNWIDWFPETDGVPGTERPGDRHVPTVGHYVVQLIRLAESAVRGLYSADRDRVRVVVPEPPGAPAEGGVRVAVPPQRLDASSLIAAAHRRVDQMSEVADGIEVAGLIAALELAVTLESALGWLSSGGSRLVTMLDGVVDRLEDRLADTLEVDEAGRRVLELVDLTATIARALIRDGVLTHRDGFDALDGYDLCDWLYLHGARRSTVDGALVRGIYDLVFAYRDGRPERRALAAGQALRGAFRMFFDYQGAFAYRMQAGMGDIVFAPYYEVLRDRGVRFEFFHRVAALHPSADASRIDEVELERQIDVGDAGYDPLIDVGGLPCWPSEPKWDLLVVPPRDEGAPLPDLESSWNQPPPVGDPVRLRAGIDFDHLVFGLSLGSVPSVCAELIEQRPEWKAMVDNVGTVQTQALQLWLSETTADLGGDADAPIVAGYVEPFDTWADMSHLIDREDWPDHKRPASIHYFCNVLSGPSTAPAPGPSPFPSEQRSVVRRNAQQFLVHDVDQFLPDAVESYPREFRWELAVGDTDEHGDARLDSQYFRANVEPSERYVQSLPGTSRYRLAPGASGYDNLVLAGDWTDCGFNAGCVEAATMSGLLAATAVTGSADTSSIIGHRHP